MPRAVHLVVVAERQCDRRRLPSLSIHSASTTQPVRIAPPLASSTLLAFAAIASSSAFRSASDRSAIGIPVAAGAPRIGAAGTLAALAEPAFVIGWRRAHSVEVGQLGPRLV